MRRRQWAPPDGWLTDWPPWPWTHEVLESHLAGHPRDPRLHAAVASSHAQSGRYLEACAAWRNAIELWDPQQDDAIAACQQGLAEALLASGCVEEAHDLFTKAAQTFRRLWRRSRVPVPAYGADLQLREAQCLVAVKEYKSATAVLDDLAAGDFGDAMAEQISLLRGRMSA